MMTEPLRVILSAAKDHLVYDGKKFEEGPSLRSE